MKGLGRQREPRAYLGDAFPLFDLFFDLPHPGASDGAERARIVEPPEVAHPEVFAELYEATNISRIARFAFPEHDDQKLVSQLSHDRTMRGVSGAGAGPLNQYDVYCHEFISQRHVFSLLLSDNETQLHGHVLRYLPPHREARSRVDLGRRGARAMVLLTQAPGGERFFGAILKTLEAVIIQGDASTKAGSLGDLGREKTMKFLHGLHRSHSNQSFQTREKIRRADSTREVVAEDVFLVLSGVECPVSHRSRLKGRVLPYDFVKYQLPQSLQVGFRMGVGPSHGDAPILPLVRCLGAVHTLRLISALLCERKVILVSTNAARLSACVLGASAVLAQGMLQWQHIFIPVLPPHLLKYLIVSTPYLIGVLEQHLGEVERMMRLKEVLCVHLDRSMLRTFDMKDPAQIVPDMMAQPHSNSKQTNPADILQYDIEQIIKVDKRWLGESADSKTTPTDEKGITSHNGGGAIKKSGLLFGKRGKSSLDDTVTSRIGHHDIASLFGKVMRGASLLETDNDQPAAREDDMEPFYFEYDKPLGKRGDEDNRKEQEIEGELTLMGGNERGEEGIRAAMTAFFLTTHGDLGELLSEDPRDQSYMLDRRKYLKCKKKEQGFQERTPMFVLYTRFSGTAMLEHHLQLRIADYQRGTSLQMARHMSLFSVCEKHLRAKCIAFSYANIRRVISKSASSSPMHALVERSEKARARAMALTSATPFDGNRAMAISAVMSDTHDCSLALPQTFAVIWWRLDDLKGSAWKHPLLGLQLLKNLVLHGPVLAVSMVMDGVTRLIRLRNYASSKSAEYNEEIREAAQQILDIIVDRPMLFLSRRHVVAVRAQLVDAQGNVPIPGKSVLRRVKAGKTFREYHKMLRPTMVPAAMVVPTERVAQTKHTTGSTPRGTSGAAANRRTSNEGPTYPKPERKTVRDARVTSRTMHEKKSSGERDKCSKNRAVGVNRPGKEPPSRPEPHVRQPRLGEGRRRDRPVRRRSSPLDSEAPKPMPARRRSSFNGGFDRSANYRAS